MKTKLRQISILIFLIWNSYFGIAQKVNLSNFFLIPDNKQVLLYWTIESGPTCNGMTVWRSTDSLNYEEVGSIPGICGSSSSATPYNFTDKSPVLNKANYYKIRLGYSQFSEVKYLRLKYIEPGKIIVKPNPAKENIVIEFNNDNNEGYRLTLYNSNGTSVFNKESMTESSFTLATAAFDAGTYFIILENSGGRILKEKLIIVK